MPLHKVRKREGGKLDFTRNSLVSVHSVLPVLISLYWGTIAAGKRNGELEN